MKSNIEKIVCLVYFHLKKLEKLKIDTDSKNSREIINYFLKKYAKKLYIKNQKRIFGRELRRPKTWGGKIGLKKGSYLYHYELVMSDPAHKKEDTAYSTHEDLLEIIERNYNEDNDRC